MPSSACMRRPVRAQLSVIVPNRVVVPPCPAFWVLAEPLPLAPAKMPVPPATVHVAVSVNGLPNDFSAPGASVD